MKLEGWIFMLASWSAIITVLGLCLFWTFRTRDQNQRKSGAD